MIDAKLTETLKRGIRRDAVDDLEREIEAADLPADRRQAVEEELEATRERQQALRKQIDTLRNLLDDSQKSIGLDEEHFRSAISSALELVGAEPLEGHFIRRSRATPLFVSFARSARGSRSNLGRHDGYAPRSPRSRSETVGVAASIADSAGGLPRPRHDDR